MSGELPAGPAAPNSGAGMLNSRKQEELKHTYVFLGPSLPREEAQKILPANYLGPVAQGDIIGLLWRQPRHILIIDGYFNRVPAVWHKELLLALERGIKIYGASSMGALRAAELDGFGLEGYGRIYEAYKNGTLVADDEVALIHGPEECGYPTLSLPLVNVRATLKTAQENGFISQADADIMLELARQIYYPDRTMDSWLAAGKNAKLALSADFVRFCQAGGVDQKREDARGLLEMVAQRLDHPTPAASPAHITADTLYLRQLIGNDQALLPGGGGQLTPQVLHEYQRLKPQNSLYEIATQRDMLATILGQVMNITITDDELEQTAAAFRKELNLHSPFALRAWLEQRNISPAHLEELLKRRLYIQKALSLTPMSLDYFYLDIIKQNSSYQELLNQLQKQEEQWQSVKFFNNPNEFSSEEWGKILQKARQAVGDTAGKLNLEQIAALTGFGDVPSLVKQLLKEGNI